MLPPPATNDVREGWYIPTKGYTSTSRSIRPRWVLGVIRGMVCYGTGSTNHRHCRVSTFKNWIRRTSARMSNSQEPSQETGMPNDART